MLGVGEGDEVFYAHPKHGLTSGKVLAHGKDGFTVAHEDGNIGVLWDLPRFPETPRADALVYRTATPSPR